MTSAVPLGVGPGGADCLLPQDGAEEPAARRIRRGASSDRRTCRRSEVLRRTAVRLPPVGPLTDAAAREAVATPIRREGAEITDEALTEIVQRTRGYPYFLQEWGSHAWNVAVAAPITADDVRAATATALTALDESFFKVRLDRLTPREKDYVRAMAELGAGPHRSGEIAKILGLRVNEAGSLRDKLIKKGMIYSPQHGDTAFTVPMFDDFMKRSMPEWKP